MRTGENFGNYVNIFSNDQERILTYLGSVFHNKKSRDMWILLSNHPNKEYYLKEMAVIIEGVDNPRLPIYEHHIKAMIKSKIVFTTEKMHHKHKTTFYRAAPFVVIAPSHQYSIAKNNILKDTFRQLYFKT